jgi:predicted transcriptional regulator
VMQQELQFGLSRRADPETSKQAARSIETTRLEAECLEAIWEARDGLTSEELAEVLDLSLVTVSPRLRPLSNKGLIVPSGKRPNRSGRMALVWRSVAAPSA